MDYNGLVAAFERRMNRSDLNAEVPEYIGLVENEVNARLALTPVRPMVKTYTLPAETDRIDLPADFIDVIELKASNDTDEWPLVRLEPQAPFKYYEKALAPGLTYDADLIRHYRVLGTTLVLPAVPSVPLSLELDCYTKLEPINENNSSNWLIDNHADVYLFGILAHGAERARDYEYSKRNQDLFTGMLEMVVQSYPEKKREIALTATDAPWSVQRWMFPYG